MKSALFASALLSLIARAFGGEALPVEFVEVAAESGIDMTVVSGSKDQMYIVEGSLGGSAFFDHDNDGDVDLYVTNGSRFSGFAPGQHPYNRLYRNIGDGQFTDVTSETAVGDTSWSLGCVAADYDNDGHTDLYVTNFGANKLYKNLGDGSSGDGSSGDGSSDDGSFEDVTIAAGVGDSGYGTGGTFGDFDRDGDVDLYLSNYIDFSRDYESTIPCVWKTVDMMCGPRGLLPQKDVFYRNEGDGTFTDATATVGMADKEFYGYGAVFADFNEDGWPDVFVADDMSPNQMFVNRGDGTFAEEALIASVGFNGDGAEQGCMGVGIGDYDNDGHLDIFVTNFEGEHNTLYRNEGDGFFLDVSFVSRLAASGNPEVGWGTALFDFDNDGDKDIFVANGHTYPQADLPHTNASYAQRNFLFENLGNGTYADVSEQAGPGLAIEKVSRGASFADYDGDGDVDVFVVNLNAAPDLLRNNGSSGNNYLLVETVGTVSNRNGIGTRIEVETAGLRQVNEVRSGGSYLSHDDMRVHFGLGQASGVAKVTLRWPSGIVQALEDVAVNQVLRVTEPAK